jgi:hypothetical protein
VKWPDSIYGSGDIGNWNDRADTRRSGVQSAKEERRQFHRLEGRKVRITSMTIGIDLGITDSAVAVFENGEPKIGV